MMSADVPLGAFVQRHVPDRRYQEAWTQLKPVTVALAKAFGLTRVLEIGGGRAPLFTASEMADLRLDYTVNDISQQQLDASPPDVPSDHKLLFDIGGSIELEGRFDLIVSKTVLEHVNDTLRAHRNTFQLLRQGGVALHFFPTLYCPPFVANRLLPEAVSRFILGRLGATHEKFPAKYDHCVSMRSLEVELLRIGYSEAFLVPFWGHGYFDRLPVLREVDRWLASQAMAHDFRPYSSYCYAITRK